MSRDVLWPPPPLREIGFVTWRDSRIGHAVGEPALVPIRWLAAAAGIDQQVFRGRLRRHDAPAIAVSHFRGSTGRYGPQVLAAVQLAQVAQIVRWCIPSNATAAQRDRAEAAAAELPALLTASWQANGIAAGAAPQDRPA